jgi:uncharacterized protein (DUF1778 family)
MKKDAHLSIRINRDERRAMHEAAKLAGVRLSELVRTLVLKFKQEQEVTREREEENTHSL